MPKQQGVWGVPWQRCDRCSFLHPVSMLITQKGMRVCTDHGCADDLTVELRPRIIAQVLQKPETRDAEQLVRDDKGVNELEF